MVFQIFLLIPAPLIDINYALKLFSINIYNIHCNNNW